MAKLDDQFAIFVEEFDCKSEDDCRNVSIAIHKKGRLVRKPTVWFLNKLDNET